MLESLQSASPGKGSEKVEKMGREGPHPGGDVGVGFEACVGVPRWTWKKG